MPRQRTDHSRIVYVFPDDFPQRLVRFREVSRMPWAEIARRLGAGPKTVRRWHKDGVRPNAHYLLALQDLAKGRGSVICSPSERRHTRQWSLRTERSPAKAPQIAPPGANRRPGGLDISKRDSGCPPKDQRCYAQTAHTPQHR